MSHPSQYHRHSPRTGLLAASFAAMALAFGLGACTIEVPKDDDDAEARVLPFEGGSNAAGSGFSAPEDGKADDPAPDAAADPDTCLPCSAYFSGNAPFDQLCGAFVDADGWLNCEPGTSCELAMAVLDCGCNSYCASRPYCADTCTTGAWYSSCLACIDDHCPETYVCQQDQ